MSAAASWANTSTATHWPLTGKDDWSGKPTWGQPVTFACDYSAEARKATDERGQEFVTRQIIYTEYTEAAAGDMVLIGDWSGVVDPLSVAAQEVRAVGRFADTFDQAAEDFKILS